PRQAIFTSALGIDKFNCRSGSAQDVSIEPALEWISRSRAPAFRKVSLISATCGVRFNLIRLAVFQIDATAVGLIAGNARAEVFVHVGHAFVIFLAKLVRFGVGIGIVFMPDERDELFTLFIGLQLLPGINLSSGKNGFYIPYPVGESVVWFALDLSLFVLW